MNNKIKKSGGARPGAGRKAINPLIRKSMPTFRMEKWFLDYLTKTFEDPAKEIMQCVCRQKGINREQFIASQKDA